MLTVNFDLLKVNRGERVLDAGCGTGRHTFHLSKSDCFVTAMDILHRDLMQVRYFLALMEKKKEKRAVCDTLMADMHYLPFRDGAFDKIVCSEVLEHIEDDAAGLRELVRALKNGGQIAVTVPTYFSEVLFGVLSEEYFNTPGGHIRKYTAKKIVTLVKSQSLAIFAVRHEHSFHTLYWLLRCVFGLHREDAALPASYKKFLDWTIISRSFKRFDRLFNWIFPKSIVLYARKP